MVLQVHVHVCMLECACVCRVFNRGKPHAQLLPNPPCYLLYVIFYALLNSEVHINLVVKNLWQITCTPAKIACYTVYLMQYIIYSVRFLYIVYGSASISGCITCEHVHVFAGVHVLVPRCITRRELTWRVQRRQTSTECRVQETQLCTHAHEPGGERERGRERERERERKRERE